MVRQPSQHRHALRGYSAAFLDGWHNYPSLEMNPYDYATQAVSRAQWESGFTAAKLWTEAGRPTDDPDAVCNELTGWSG